MKGEGGSSCTPHGAVLEPPGGLGRSLAVCHCWEWQARSGASEHAFGRRECQKHREESAVCFPVWDAGYAEIGHGEKVLGRGHTGWSRTPQRRY